MNSYSSYTADVMSISDYYPFGFSLPGRQFDANSYDYGFNGMEQDDEVKSSGNSYTTQFRQYDPRLGRWLSLDPLMSKYPGQNPYAAFNNNPIYYSDPSGLEGDEPLKNTHNAPVKTRADLANTNATPVKYNVEETMTLAGQSNFQTRTTDCAEDQCSGTNYYWVSDGGIGSHWEVDSEGKKVKVQNGAYYAVPVNLTSDVPMANPYAREFTPVTETPMQSNRNYVTNNPDGNVPVRSLLYTSTFPTSPLRGTIAIDQQRVQNIKSTETSTLKVSNFEMVLIFSTARPTSQTEFIVNSYKAAGFKTSAQYNPSLNTNPNVSQVFNRQINYIQTTLRNPWKETEF